MTVTNDGATILKSLHIDNPAAKVLVGILMLSYCCIIYFLLLVLMGVCSGLILSYATCYVLTVRLDVLVVEFLIFMEYNAHKDSIFSIQVYFNLELFRCTTVESFQLILVILG